MHRLIALGGLASLLERAAKVTACRTLSTGLNMRTLRG